MGRAQGAHPRNGVGLGIHREGWGVLERLVWLEQQVHLRRKLEDAVRVQDGVHRCVKDFILQFFQRLLSRGLTDFMI